jgi:hypothetical protein
MSANMVRTQVYLPPEVHATLTQRAEQQGLTLAQQIRTALDEYLARTAAGDEGATLRPDDPLFSLAGLVDSGVNDLGRNHDHYLYGAPRRPSQPAPAVAEGKPPSYKPRAKKKKSR